MNKIGQWIVWSLALLAVNIPTISLALFSLFATAEGTSIFSIDYLIALGIILVGNIISIQLFLAIRKKHSRSFVHGLLVAVAQGLGLYLVTLTFNPIWLIVVGISIVLALVLLVKEVISQ